MVTGLIIAIASFLSLGTVGKIEADRWASLPECGTIWEENGKAHATMGHFLINSGGSAKGAFQVWGDMEDSTLHALVIGRDIFANDSFREEHDLVGTCKHEGEVEREVYTYTGPLGG